MAASASAQAAAATPPKTSDKASAYDVITVKPSKPSAGLDFWSRWSPDGISMTGATVQTLIIESYDILTPDQIANLPAWASSDRFDIEAKMDEDAMAAIKKLPDAEQSHQHQLMMQSLLADRFQLRVHHATKMLPVYDLVVAKGGLKLKETAEDENSGWSKGRGSYSGHRISTDDLVFILSNEVGRIIVDKTGLAGKYDIALKWTPDEMAASAGQQANASPPAADAPPSIFTALEEQLGLKLESAKGPVDTIVVDHVEKPSEN
jgi:uncharacterized protein (TIGR03435 family)